MEITRTQLPALRLATVLHQGPLYQIGVAFERLRTLAERTGLRAYPGALLVAVYDEDPEGKPVEALRSRAGIRIPDGIRMPEGLVEHHVPAGVYACYTHRGGYERLGEVWSRYIKEALPASGHVVAEGPVLEIYRSDMRTTPKAELLTDLLVPIQV
jgi:AraC family transcriptional regulator